MPPTYSIVGIQAKVLATPRKLLKAIIHRNCVKRLRLNTISSLLYLSEYNGFMDFNGLGFVKKVLGPP
ncbi:hypothetical protein BGP_4412 [Beggiatoa sp. PS]|nr:hypothetical protein BGP_4412 [Beggiatoa sp. PS]